MSQQDTSLDDITQSITELGTMISQEITTTKQDLKAHVDIRAEELRGDIKALESDIKAIYKMLSGVQKDTKELRKTDKQLDRRLTNLERFAHELSLKTSVPFES